MSNVIPAARAAAERIQCLQSGRFVALTDTMALIISEHMREREVEWEEWRAALQNAWAEDLRATMTALLEGGPERRNP